MLMKFFFTAPNFLLVKIAKKIVLVDIDMKKEISKFQISQDHNAFFTNYIINVIHDPNNKTLTIINDGGDLFIWHYSLVPKSYEELKSYKDLHYSKQKLIEMIPGKKITWLVEEGWLSFVNKKDEWVGTKIIFEISQKGNKTLIHFTHQGLVPACECFDACTNGWSYYLLESLAPLITTGSGQPDKKEAQQVAL